MSAIALDLMKQLRQGGVAEDNARQIAEAFDHRAEKAKHEAVQQALREAKQHAEQVAQREADKADAKFVRREENESKFDAFRAEMKAFRAEMNTKFAEVHGELKSIRTDIQYLKWGLFAILAVLLADLVGRFLA